MNRRNRNELWAGVLLDELARGGVRDLAVSPGSRSGPLVLAAASDPRFRIHVQVDERSAGFVALGVGKGTGAPGAVITTSGTAVANLLPAVVEAAQSETPLLLITADRPARLRGGDANQTIDQTKIFGGFVRRFEELSPGEPSESAVRHLRSAVARALAAALGDPAGPVHLDMGFDKPLEPVPVAGDLPDSIASGASSVVAGRPDGAPWTEVRRRRTPPPEGVAEALRARLSEARRPLIVAGVLPRPWETGPAVRAFAARAGIPLLADPLSGARFPAPGAEAGSGARRVPGTDRSPEDPEGPVVGGYDLALRDPGVREALRPDFVIRVGAAPTSSALASWLEGCDPATHLVVDAGDRWKDHAGVATEQLPVDPGLLMQALLRAEGDPPESSRRWASRWREIEAVVSGALAEAGEAAGPAPPEALLVRELVAAIPADDLLLVSNSMPVRELDGFVPARERPLTVLGNRGASGIDGIVSTAAGASLATGRRVVALLGDLALLHDANGLASLRDPRVRVALLVLNNDGGGIFHLLPVRAFEPAFTPYFATPHGRRFGALADFHGLPHASLDARPEAPAPAGLADLRRALETFLSQEGSGVLEILTDREHNRIRRGEIADRAARSAASTLSER